MTLTERDLRASFINCSKGEAKRLDLPKGFADLPGTTWTSSAGKIRARPNGRISSPSATTASSISLRVASGGRPAASPRAPCARCA